MEEIWKDIKGYEGYYQVSNLGRVKSLERVVVRSNGRSQRFKEITMRTSVNNSKYPSLILNKEGVWKSALVHRLVAQAFIPNPENKPQVNHKNGVKTDNNVNNLEWCTRSENAKHSYAIGTQYATIGEDNKLSKLTNEQVKNIRLLYANGGLTHKLLAKYYSISISQVGKIINKKSWRHV